MSYHYESKIDTKDLKEQNLDDHLNFFHRAHTVLQIKKVQLLLLGPHHDDTACLMRLNRALGEFAIDGVETTIPLFEKLLPDEDFRAADYDIHWLEKFLGMKD